MAFFGGAEESVTFAERHRENYSFNGRRDANLTGKDGFVC